MRIAYTNKRLSIELVLGISPFVTSLWFAPWAVCGIILASTSGFILHLIPGRWVLIMCGVFKLIAVLLFALMPANPNYWAAVFPAMVAEAACIDVIWTVTNVFITTNLPSHRQGLAGAFINCTLYIGICCFLGIADIAVGSTANIGLAGSYKVAFWIGVAFSGLALAIFFTMDIGSAKSDLTRDEKTALVEGSS
jgi:MFS family permease